MGSLTGCIRKAGALLDAEDKAALLARVRELRSEGVKATEAAMQAIQERIAHVGELLTQKPAEPVVEAEVKPPADAPGLRTPGELFQSASIRAGKETLEKYGLDPGKRYNTRDIAAAGGAGRSGAPSAGEGAPGVRPEGLDRNADEGSAPGLDEFQPGLGESLAQSAVRPHPTDTPEFKAWFGDSKVVDADGKPLVVYHGTRQDFDAFAYGDPVHFASDPDLASRYSNIYKGKEGESRVVPAYISLTNPKRIVHVPRSDDIKAAKAAGHDGFVVGDDGHFVVFRPEQIKSATGNRGTFDPSNPSILAQGDRGSFTPESNTLTLFKGADLSTFLHESGHFFLEVYADVAGNPQAPQALKADVDTLLKFAGHQGDIDSWRALPLEQRRTGHEKIAQAFERYLLEGKPPSMEMRPLFARFRSWLLNVYQSLRQMGAEITPEVRQVFDRMLASEDAIREAEALRSYEPLFKTAEEAGLTDKQFADYQAIGQQASDAALDTMQARSMRDMKWASNAKAKALKALQKQADAERKVITEEVTREINADPAFSAAEMLRAHQGAEPEVVAEMHGFDSADAMMQAIRDAGDRKDVIQATVDQRMLQRHGDLIDPKSIEDAANEAVHNEARARFLATGLKALTKSPLPAREIARAAKEAADTAIARKRVRDLDPNAYLHAETRANRDALAAVAKDPAAAIEAQRAAVLNNRLARASLDAKADVDKGVDYLGKFDSEGVRKKLDVEYIDQIDSLLERFDLRRGQSLKSIDKRASLADWVQSQREMGLEPDIPPELLAEASRKHYRDMTVEEFRGLVDTVKQIEHLGRLKHKLLTARDQRAFEAVKADIVDSLIANGGGRNADTRTPNTPLGEAKVGLTRFWASHIKAATWARIMDGGKDGGQVWENVIRGANEAGDRETVMRAKATKELMALVAPVLKEGGMGGKGQYFPTVKRSLNKEARLAIALNLGNDGNRQRLLAGEGWTPEQLQPVLDTLTSADWKFVQSVWDHFETYRPLIAAKERRVYGKEPKWVEPTPLHLNTADGQVVDLPGGYYPIKYDPRASARAEAFDNAQDIAQQMQGAYTSATTRRSFTKARAEEVRGRPLLYTLDGIYSGTQEVIHDLAWHEYLIDANRLMKDPEIAGTIRETYGPEVHQQFKNWLQDVAVGDRAAQQAGESALAWIRQGVSISGLGFNVMNALIQPIGLTQSIVRIGPQWVGRGIAKALGAPIETAGRISEMSDFMANRFMTRNREINELRNQVRGQSKVRRAVDTTAYTLMLRAQQLVDIPTWWGAYEKAIAEANPEDRAIALADQAVIDSQGSGMQKDLAAIERGGPALKLFTTFYSFFNTALNVGAERTMTQQSKAALAANYLMLYVVPAVLAAALKDAVTPGDSENWDDPEKVARKLAGEQLGYLTNLMFGLREIGAPLANILKSEGFGTDYQGPAGLRMIGDALKVVKQAEQLEADDALRKAVINLAGDLFRLPAAQVNRTITGIEALNEGKTENPAAVVFGYQEPR